MSSTKNSYVVILVLLEGKYNFDFIITKAIYIFNDDFRFSENYKITNWNLLRFIPFLFIYLLESELLI